MSDQSKHGWTKGPWRDGQGGNLRVYGPDGCGEDSGLIAVVYKGRANAALIAAAPELYEALHECLQFAVGKPYLMATEALAKARGEN